MRKVVASKATEGKESGAQTDAEVEQRQIEWPGRKTKSIFEILSLFWI